MIFTRRRVLAWTSGALSLGRYADAFAADFWNRKSAGEWSPEEVRQLLKKSPWAKQVSAYAPVRGVNRDLSAPDASSSRQGDRTGPVDSGQVVPRAANRRADVSSDLAFPGPGQEFKGTVRWESARPILDAVKTILPRRFTNSYVIGVSGFPMGDVVSATGVPKLTNYDLEHIRISSFLTPKNRGTAQARVVQLVGSSVLVGFSRNLVRLTPEDKEIAFASRLGRLQVRAKFHLKEMQYHGALAL